MEDFANHAKTLIEILGYKLFDSCDNKKIQVKEKETTLYLHLRMGEARASGRLAGTGKEFMVLKGSRILPITDNTIPEPLKKLRKEAPVDDFGILKEDVVLLSPSAAAEYVTGRRISGLIAWTTSDGRTLKQLKSDVASK